MSKARVTTVVSIVFVAVSFVWITVAYPGGSPSSAAPYCTAPLKAPDATYTNGNWLKATWQLPKPVGTGYTYALVPTADTQSAIKKFKLRLTTSGKFSYWLPSSQPAGYRFRMAFDYVIIVGGCKSKPGHVQVRDGGLTPGSGIRIDLVATPTSGAAPLRVDFSSTVSRDPANRYSINYGDGSPVESLRVPTASHRYTRAGTYTPVLRVRSTRSSTREGSASVTITVAPAVPTAAASKTLTCKATVAEADGSTISADAKITISGTRTGSDYAFTTARWAFTNAIKTDPQGVTSRRSLGKKSQFLIQAPTAWASPATLGPSGQIAIPKLQLKRGQSVKVEARPDVTGAHPTCVTSATI